ncbi:MULTISPECIES: ABC transporter permease [Kitasatospora]|uniref:ABC transporter permease n=1 Tax=Kitasatospora cystarginea TaxID=58350 RepID=A0ABN3ERX0_9ACTN
MTATHPTATATATAGAGRWTLWRFVLRRLLSGALVLLAVSAIVFAATGAAAGDAASVSLGGEADPAAIAARRAELGLDRPALVRYGGWLLGVLHGDLGRSYVSGTPVADLLCARAGNSLVLAGVTVALLVPVSLGLGVWAGLRAGGLADRVVALVTLSLVSLPEFVTGTVLVLLLAVELDWLPAVSVLGPGQQLADRPQILVLPVVTLLVACVAHNARLVRAGVVAVSAGDAVATARLNGVPEHRVVLRYVLPAAIPPVIPLLARYLSLLVGGALVAETLFGYPGLASMLVQASAGRDVPTVQAAALTVAAVTVLVNLLGDLLGVLVDPLRRMPQ